MIGAVEVLQIGINNLGVVPRDKSADYLPFDSKYDDYQQGTTTLISPDGNNEYNITESLIAFSRDSEIYDKDVKILEWYYDAQGCLFVESYTDRQINLFADLQVKGCVIKAKGPLFINGKLESKSTIAIDAQALWLAEPLTCTGNVLLTVLQGVGLLAPIKAHNLIINAGYLHHEADLQLTGQFDVSTKYFKQNALVNTTVNSLRLITSQQCQMRGVFTVNEGCFLTANNLLWGHEKSESTLRLHGNIHIHVNKLHIQGETQVYIEHPDSNTEGQFLVDHDFFVDKTAIVDVYNTKLSTTEIDNHGELSFHQCSAKAKIVQQHGIFDAEQSLVTIYQNFIHEKEALTELKDTNFNSPTIEVYDGQFNLNGCTYKGQSCNVHAGSFEINNQSDIEIDKLLLWKKANSNIKNSKINAHHSIQTSGEIFFENADVNTNFLKTLKSKISIKHSKINTKTQIKLWGTIELIDSRLTGEIMTLSGVLAINNVRLTANFLDILSEQAAITSLFILSEKLELQGSKKEDQVVIKNSALTTKQFSSLNHITLDCSTFKPEKSEINKNDVLTKCETYQRESCNHIR